MAWLLVVLACETSGEGRDTAADTGPAAEPARSLAAAPVRLTGAASAAAGNAVALARRADGPAVVVVAAYFEGVVCAWAGAPAAGTHALADADACWTGGTVGDFAGYALASGADLDGDGADDLLVGAVGDATAGASGGAVYVLGDPLVGGALAGAGTTLYGEDAADLAGSGVAFAGDVDGDGAGDLLVGASGNDTNGLGGGRVYLVRGPLPAGAALLSDVATATVTGSGDPAAAPPHGAPVAGDGLGVALAGVGDLDGDGLDDVALGANGHDEGGRDAGLFVVFLGPLDGARHVLDADQRYHGDSAAQYAGDTVARAGDLDGDGRADVLVGDTLGSGTTWVVAGPGVPDASALRDVATSFVGETDGDLAGAAVAGAGDVDGDGWLDVLVGAYGHDGGGAEVGAAYVAHGPFGAGAYALGTADGRWIGAIAGEQAGRAVAGGADADGDGRDDLLIGAPASDLGAAAGGAAYLVLAGG